jgi:hypothetical protein
LTAITITDDGASVECWEVDALLPKHDEAHKNQPIDGLYIAIGSYPGAQVLLDNVHSNEDDESFFDDASYVVSTSPPPFSLRRTLSCFRKRTMK